MGLFPGDFILGFLALSKNDRAGFLSLADIAAQLLGLMECQPERAFILHRMEHQDIDAAIGLLADKVAGESALDIPRLAPRDCSLREQGNHALGDAVIDAAVVAGCVAARAELIGLVLEPVVNLVLVIGIHGVFFTVRADRFWSVGLHPKSPLRWAASGGCLQEAPRPAPGGKSGRVRPTEQGREAREKSDMNADQAQNNLPKHSPRSGRDWRISCPKFLQEV